LIPNGKLFLTLDSISIQILANYGAHKGGFSNLQAFAQVGKYKN
jgi:hypothetical protein